MIRTVLQRHCLLVCQGNYHGNENGEEYAERDYVACGKSVHDERRVLKNDSVLLMGYEKIYLMGKSCDNNHACCKQKMLFWGMINVRIFSDVLITKRRRRLKTVPYYGRQVPEWNGGNYATRLDR